MTQDLTAAEVKRRIREKGVTLAQLSERAGFSRSAASIALKNRSPYVQQAIADFLGVAPQDIWPSRYDVNGSPIRMDPRGRRGLTHPKTCSRQQKDALA